MPALATRPKRTASFYPSQLIAPGKAVLALTPLWLQCLAGGFRVRALNQSLIRCNLSR